MVDKRVGRVGAYDVWLREHAAPTKAERAAQGWLVENAKEYDDPEVLYATGKTYLDLFLNRGGQISAVSIRYGQVSRVVIISGKKGRLIGMATNIQ